MKKCPVCGHGNKSYASHCQCGYSFEVTKDCPFCKTVNEPKASQCDCGYSFDHGCIIPMDQRSQAVQKTAVMSKKAQEGANLLQNGEVVWHWSEGLYEGRNRKLNAAVLATDTRLVIFAPKFFGRYEMEEFPYSSMTSIEMSKDFIGRSATFIASNNRERISMMALGNPEALIAFVRSKIGQKSAPAPQPAQEDFTGKLEKLAAMREKGLLSDEEFLAAKKKLLAP